MAAAQTIGAGSGIAKLRWQGQGTSQSICCTIGYHPRQPKSGSGPGSNHDPQIAAQTINDAWVFAFPMASMSSSYKWEGVETAYWETPQVAGMSSVPPMVGDYPQSVQGGYGGGTVPPAVALLVYKITGVGGKANKGRMYLPGGYGISANIGDNGGINSAMYEDTQGYLDQFMENLNDTDVDIQLMLYHGVRTKDGVEVGPAGQPTPIIKLGLSSLVATQRLRQAH